MAAARVRLREIVTEDPSSWDQAWVQGTTPWDTGAIQPPLREVVESGELQLPTTGRVLVPGCGSGFDAVYLASRGFETLALDISKTAAQIASSNIPAGSKVRIEVCDFFKFTSDEKFDVIYDYTFFVAIPPSRRKEWGAQMNSLVKPGGYLITLIYPIEPQSDVGPPFFVRPEHYLEPLGDGWEKVVDRVPTISNPTHVGIEHLVVWKKL